MAAWIRQGLRLDVALAVALEIGRLHLERARGEDERGRAMDYNLRLWHTIRRLAATAPDLGDRDALKASADLVEASRANPAAVMTRNMDLARVLAGRAATHGALKHLLEEWLSHRTRRPDAEFGAWLLARMDAEGAPLSVAA